jgi:hypothetical protein
MCSLAICKPGIRRVAERGDWVAGLGSKAAPSGDLSGRLVYAMRIEEVLSLKDYDRLAKQRWPHRIPNIKSLALQDRLGDCLYDYSHGSPVQRKGVHGRGNIETDLSGENVLLSRDFYYFGNKAISLPDDLLPICHQSQGHRSSSNSTYFRPFVRWIRSVVAKPGQLYGWPDFILDWGSHAPSRSCKIREIDDRHDPSC